MSSQDHMLAKLEAFYQVLNDLIEEARTAGLPEKAVRRTLLTFAENQFKSDPSDGCAALAHFHEVLQRDLVLSSVK